MNLILGRFLCWLTRKHKRGILLGHVGDLKTFACPRCGRTTQYQKAKKSLKAVA